MTARKWFLGVGLAICLTALGCDDTAVRQIALQLRAAVLEDERLLNNNITKQKEFYEEQRKTIEDARSNNIKFNVDTFRRRRSADGATRMSLDPNTEARLANLMKYLDETHDMEFEVWQELYGRDQQDREELKSRIAKLEQQKKLLEQVKKNLDQLAVATNSKKRAKALLQFSQQTHAAYKKAGQ